MSHEALVQLVRSAPEMVVDLLRREQTLDLPLHLPTRITATEFVDLNLAEYRADVVLVLGDPERPSRVIVVEVQNKIDVRKRRVWPVYVAGLRVRYGCPVLLVVIAPDPSVAAWCGESIDLGHGRCVLHPLVIGPEQVPVITEFEVAIRAPELAVLSFAAHGREPGAELIALAAIEACLHLDNDRNLLYPDFVFAHLGEVARAALEKIMQMRDYEFQSDLFRKVHADALRESLAVGMDPGMAAEVAMGVVRGVAEDISERAAEVLKALTEGKAEVLLMLLRRKFTKVEAGVEARVLACRDPAKLNVWAERVLDADSVAAVFS